MFAISGVLFYQAVKACISEYIVANKTTHFQQYVFFILFDLLGKKINKKI